MAHYWSDNVLTTAFTPRDYQVELLAAAREKNIIISITHNSSKEFIALKLVHELGYELRSPDNFKQTLYLSTSFNAESAFNLFFHLSDLTVINVNTVPTASIEWEDVIQNQVIILSIESCLDALICGYIDLNQVNLIVIEECHKTYGKSELQDILSNYYVNTDIKPKILGLAGPLHSPGCPLGRLGAELEYLEKFLHAKTETASDVVTVLRYCSKPIEIILQCAPPTQSELTEFLCDLVQSKKQFILDHRFDPSEIYEGFQEEINVIPDPKVEPLKFFDEFLNILGEFGPWSADRAASMLLLQIEKCKVKTPYERHFLLLCLTSTALVEIRFQCETIFKQIINVKERIECYSTPKALRLIEIFRQFSPVNRADQLESTAATPFDSLVSKDHQISPRNKINIEKLDSVDFVQTKVKLETVTGEIANHETPQDVLEVTNTLNQLVGQPQPSTSTYRSHPSPLQGPRRKYRGRGGFGATGQRRHSSHYSHNESSDSLCGIIFCNSKYFAKVLFNLLCEFTRHDPSLKYLNVQYTVEKEVDPLNGSNEAEEHRKQEEVLKKFRIHECNLLIGTSVLEEGIDLPKCNLVVRWDVPVTYRSYVQCKGRARASHAYHILMAAPKPSIYNVECDSELLDKKIHKFGCTIPKRSSSVDSDNESNSSASSRSSDGVSDDSKAENENICNVSFDEAELNLIEKQKSHMKTEDFKQMTNVTNDIIEKLAEYKEIEKMLLRKCENKEPINLELQHADKFTSCIEEYRPLPHIERSASVNLSTAVSLVNKYCAKLPSDTFTKLTPLWRVAVTTRNSIELYLCTLRLPINSPIKQDIVGLPMITRILARRTAALIACKILHQSGELDDNLQPIGKENFRASEPDWENFELETEDEQIVSANSEPRPGTTKRRQYYYKRIASTFSNCRPTAGQNAFLYHISMVLSCPIPEEQNTRGRKIYPPEDSKQGFGILTTKQIPKVSAFPIFTRSGEVKVSLELESDKITLTEDQLQKIYNFIYYTFTNVLRLQKYLMLFDSNATENSFFIVPTIKTRGKIDVDWKFLDLINRNMESMPKSVSDEQRKSKEFDPNLFRDAVVMPWYRNQDQPQYFYVAEICYHLTPDSAFPGENYTTFQEYYFKKYDIEIQNRRQPLLDVDHTSARLNFLTPRYVNRKGVALPTSSEETKRAKRENLEQKQILVPELCTIHPFPASLWRAAVCLPCILYRINALLLADEIRKLVSGDLGLGKVTIDYESLDWPTLDFGWSLADVLKKSREARITTINNKKENIVTLEDADIDEKTEISNSDKEEKVDKKGVESRVEIEEKAKPKDGNKLAEEKTANDILEEEDRKLKESMMEIGIWSNEMAENIPENTVDDEAWDLLPPNINICSRNNTHIRYGSPTSWDVNTKDTANAADNYYSDSDISYQSDDESESLTHEGAESRGGVALRFEFKGDNVAEAFETEEEIRKREKKIAILKDRKINEANYQISKNIFSGFDCSNTASRDFDLEKSIKWHESEFEKSITKLKETIQTSGMVISHDQKLELKPKKNNDPVAARTVDVDLIHEMIPYAQRENLDKYFDAVLMNNDQLKLTIKDLYTLNLMSLNDRHNEIYTIEGSGDIFDSFYDNSLMIYDNKLKQIEIRFTEEPTKQLKPLDATLSLSDILEKNGEINDETVNFSFDYQPNLNGHAGPSPSIILQALTMSNANDGINLERLETIGDSFLKYAITTYLYCSYENVHEGKLSHLRSKQVSNLNLYRLGRRKILGESMIATKFEPHDNWLPPCYYVPRELEKALIEAKIPACHWNLAEFPNLKETSSEAICELVRKRVETLGLMDDMDVSNASDTNTNPNGIVNLDNFPCFIPYNLVTQHSIPDKSIADCVEALIGAYLIECGPRGALLFMAWLGIRVLPAIEIEYNPDIPRIPGSTKPIQMSNNQTQTVYGHWSAPKSPLLKYAPNADEALIILLDGYSSFEDVIGYHFKDRSYLLQAMTHASYTPNRLTDCYQRLEFLGDAVLDYLITRHLYEDPRQHSPGALTDLRSALVNNTIFASLAVRHGFHKYFRHLSPGLNEVIVRFVRIQHENGHSISEEFYLLSEEECDEAEDVEVPKALGDVFESVAGAIFLDSSMSLDTVWKVYSNMMRPEIDQFSNSVPKSPIRELLELEPETAKFGKPEKLADGRRVRVTVEVFGKGTFRGIGRNYRIAKCTAAKCALRQLKKQGFISKKH